MDPILIPSADGTAIACWRHGSGPPIVLVHGGLCDHLAWFFVTPLLARNFTVWSFDRRGRGGSGDTPPHSVWREAEDVLAVLQAVGEPAHLAGHSAGAILALSAATASGSIRSLTVYDPPYVLQGTRERPSARTLQEIESSLAVGDLDGALRIAMRESVEMSDLEIDAMQASAGWEHLRGAAPSIPYDWKIWDEQFLPSQLSEIGIPTSVLLGETSPGWIQASTRAVAAAIPGARLSVLDGQGHSAMITAPEMFAARLAEFAIAR